MLRAAEFERLVARAMDDLHPFIQARMNNVDVVIVEWPSRRELREAGVPDGDTLLGLYQGIPLTERTSDYGLVPPDVITLYQGPIELEAGSAERIADVVRQTIVHELAHHFGISDERLDELGAY